MTSVKKGVNRLPFLLEKLVAVYYGEFMQHQGTKLLDSSWLGWVKENLGRGCNPVEIRDILLKKGFALPAIALAMGNSFPTLAIAPMQTTQPVQMMSPKTSSAFVPMPGVDYVALTEIPLLSMGKLVGAKRFNTSKLQLITIDNFLTVAECDKLVTLINSDLRDSTITYAADGFRTSKTCDLALLKNTFVKTIDKKIAQALGISINFSEGIQGQKYQVGQEFKPHTDYFEPGSSEYTRFASAAGNRTWTFMIYLNDTQAGGGTKFVNINHEFFPKKRQAVVWNNLYRNGAPNHDTQHWGRPVEKGEKYIITKWFRERGSGEMFS